MSPWLRASTKHPGRPPRLTRPDVPCFGGYRPFKGVDVGLTMEEAEFGFQRSSRRGACCEPQGSRPFRLFRQSAPHMTTTRTTRESSTPGDEPAIGSDAGRVDRVPRVFSLPVSGPGLLIGVVVFATSLFPSLLPKLSVTQGVVSGISFMVGYGLATGWTRAWHYFELPSPSGGWWRLLRWTSVGLVAYASIVSVWSYVGWQNELRDTFGMSHISPVAWLIILPVAFVVAGTILVVARSIRRGVLLFARLSGRIFPWRLARLVGALGFVFVLWGLWSGVLVNGFFAGANQIFASADVATEEGVAQPTSELRSGSPDSLVEWDTLGVKGRTFVSTGPSVDELNAFHGEGAMEPIRAYVGLKSADTVEARARLLLDELIRTNAFDRGVLVVATTTGTGFLEPNAMTALEFVEKGDVAVAAAQYSYLPSWISLLADQDEVKETSQAVFDTIHAYWSTIPEAERPEIYLYGLSLGSLGVESILTSINIINEPIDGALMVGPPFTNGLWNELVANRDPSSSPVTPIYQGGRTVRFTNQEKALDIPDKEWGDTRIVYLQHASDPVVFFSPSLFFEHPDWLVDAQRGVEISADFHYARLITGWQVMMDLPAAGSIPEGYGHLYTKQANAQAWIAVTRPDGWNDADTQRLLEFFDGQSAEIRS